MVSEQSAGCEINREINGEIDGEIDGELTGEVIDEMTSEMGSEMSNEESNTESNKVVMYSTRFCPYCMRARSLLQSKGVAYDEIAVDRDPGKRREMTERAQSFTVPQIWIGDTHVGGCDELFQLERQGKLDPMLLSSGA